MTVHLHAVIGSHCETMLVAYFPREQVIVKADVYSPAAAVHVFAGKFLEDIRARGLSIETIVPLRGAAVPFVKLVRMPRAAGSGRGSEH